MLNQWYAGYYCGVPVGELVPGNCFYSSPDLHPEMRVVFLERIDEGGRGYNPNLTTPAKAGVLHSYPCTQVTPESE